MSTIQPSVFFFRDPAPTDIYTLSLHDALPISDDARRESRDRSQQCHCQAARLRCRHQVSGECPCRGSCHTPAACHAPIRSEEHTSELQSRRELVCRLLLEKKKASSS